MANLKPIAEPHDDDALRESIWSVRQEDRPAFARWFACLFVVGMAFLAWYEVGHVVTDGFFDTLKSIVFGIGPTGASAIVLTFFRFEGGDVVGVALDIHRKMQLQKGIERGREEGREEREALEARVAELEKIIAQSRDAKSGDDD